MFLRRISVHNLVGLGICVPPRTTRPGILLGKPVPGSNKDSLATCMAEGSEGGDRRSSSSASLSSLSSLEGAQGGLDQS